MGGWGVGGGGGFSKKIRLYKVKIGYGLVGVSKMAYNRRTSFMNVPYRYIFSMGCEVFSEGSCLFL